MAQSKHSAGLWISGTGHLNLQDLKHFKFNNNTHYYVCKVAFT